MNTTAVSVQALQLFLTLVLCHVAADYWMQSDALAKMKNRNRDSAAFCPPGQKPQAVWPYALTAHAAMHGALVGFFVGSWWIGFAEVVAHWLIDFGKCENWYGMHADQAMHIACKALWVGVVLWLWLAR